MFFFVNHCVLYQTFRSLFVCMFVLIASYQLQLTDFGHQHNYKRLEIRQSEGEWGTICCSTYCDMKDGSEEYITDLRDVCRMLGYVSVIGIRHDLEPSASTTSVHLSLDYYKQREININVSSIYELGFSDWFKPKCSAADSIYLSCLSGKYVLKIIRGFIKVAHQFKVLTNYHND